MIVRRSKRLADMAVSVVNEGPEKSSELVKKEDSEDEVQVKRPKRVVNHVEIKLEETSITQPVVKQESINEPLIPSIKIKEDLPLIKTEEDLTHSIKKEEHDVDPMGKYRATFDEEAFWKKYPEDGKGAPANWREIYRRVKIMRTQQLAPVDTMGCERLPQAVSKVISPKVHRFQLLIALMLSAQTKDEVTAYVMSNLRKELPGNELTVSSILATSEQTIDKLIYKVGFHSRKAAYIKRACAILRDEYNDDIPPTVESMQELPGVGPKMAYLLAQRAWGIVDGIGVDVHVHRLANLWKWTRKPTSTPEKTRLELQEWLPKSLWLDINPTLVGFGQTICLPRGSKCTECLVGPICPAYRSTGGGGTIHSNESGSSKNKRKR